MTGTGGSAGSAGSARRTGSGGSAGGGQTIVLPCDGVEPTVNDTHAQATPLAIGHNGTLIEAAADHDFYQVLHVLVDAAGGTSIAITEVGAFRADATSYSSSDFAELKSSTGARTHSRCSSTYPDHPRGEMIVSKTNLKRRRT